MGGSTQDSLLAQLERAWNEQDAIAVGACFSHDGWCEWRGALGRSTSESGWPRVEGRAAIVRCAKQVMRMAPQKTLAFPLVSYGSDRRIWAEWSLTTSGGHDFPSIIGVAVLGLTDHGFTEACLYGDPFLFRPRMWRPRGLARLHRSPRFPGTG